MDYLIASTQYTDMRGTSAADDADQRSLSTYLREKKLLGESEFIVAIDFFYTENSTSIRVIVATSDDLKLIAESSKNGTKAQPKSLRVVRLDASISELLKFFKRFNVVLIDKGLEAALSEIDIDNLPDRN